jgi:hypothetical protein
MEIHDPANQNLGQSLQSVAIAATEKFSDMNCINI